MGKTYKHIFFDLDHTLWDFERNAEETKREIFEKFNLFERGIKSYEAFRGTYLGINRELWAMYREDIIDKHELNFRRFYDTLFLLGVDDRRLGEDMASFFIEGVSSKTYLFPCAKEILEYLYPKYQLHIITNGFEEVQFRKLKNSDLERYFTCIITSEEAEAMKPSPEIFNFALNEIGASITESIMVGDDLEIDIGGARAVGMDQLFVNHEKKQHQVTVTIEVFSLDEIKNFI